MIPVTILTGFLGSGKTTLLASLLRQPALSRTAVIINEFGEIGLDHELVEASTESIVTLETGCLCCQSRGDLAATLADLLQRRDAGSVSEFERVVIETSGLADPAPILQLLMLDQMLAARLVLSTVITTVDAMAGAATLAREAVSLKQAAVADRLIVTKTDLSGNIPDDLANRLRELNPAAALHVASFGHIAAERLLSGGSYDLARRSTDVAAWLAAPDVHAQPNTAGAHDPTIACFAITREAPLAAVALTLFLETLAEHCGRDLVRMKGIVQLAESPERPAVVHGVQHVFHAPVLLARWPSPVRQSRLVFFARGIPKAWIEALLDAIAAEVADIGG